MFLLEYQAKKLLVKYGFRVPEGILAQSPELAEMALGVFESAFLKAQIPSGGRGKKGGVVLVKSQSEAGIAAKKMLGRELNGYPVNTLLVEKSIPVAKEYYLSVILDAASERPMIIFSAEGGMDIESVARDAPEDVVRASVDPLLGLQDYQVRHLLNSARVKKDFQSALFKLVKNLYKAFWELDCQLLEINPLARTDMGEFFALDAKMVVDENALFRQPVIKTFRQVSSEEARAEKAKINYIALDGDIGIIGTGAGMAMVNMDQIAYFGGKPANFLDVGPSMNIHGGKAGMDILLERDDLNAIMVSGFTGSRLDVLAQDILDSLNEHPDARVPVVLRLEGRNQEQAIETLRRCTYQNLHFCDDFDQVARVAVELGEAYRQERSAS